MCIVFEKRPATKRKHQAKFVNEFELIKQYRTWNDETSGAV